MKWRALLIVGFVFATTALVGCGSSPRTTMLTLDLSVPPVRPAAYAGPTIVVPSVRVPAALDRMEFVRQVRAGQVELADDAQWAAPLGLLVRDALVRDLMARFPSGAVLPPGGVSTRATVLIDVQIVSLDVGGGRVRMEAAWRQPPAGAPRVVTLETPLAAPLPVPSAQAIGTLVGMLADRIAAASTSFAGSTRSWR